MTITAAEHVGVNFVTEQHVAHLFFFESNIFGWMAGRTIFGDREGDAAVMAGPARLAFFHLRHADRAGFVFVDT